MGESIGALGSDYELITNNSKYSDRQVDVVDESENTSYMDFESYLQLLVAQMSNQDFNDPMSDAEVLNQMATYSMLEGIKNMTSQSNISYASSLVGKAVTIAEGDIYDTGIIDSVIITNGKPSVIVNGVAHELSTISDIVEADKYNNLAALIGQKGYATVEGEQIWGEITNVLIIGGTEWVVIDKTALCMRESVTIGEPPTDEGTEGSEGSEGSEGTEGTEGSGGSDETVSAESYSVSYNITDNNVSSYAVTQDITVSKSYEEKAAELLAELMSELDGVSSSNEFSDVDITGYEQIYITEIETPDYASAAYAEEDRLLESFSSGYNPNINGSYNEVLGENYTNTGGSYNAVTTSDCVPFRKNAQSHPEEAAKADSYGTRMYDIAWINNTSVLSGINTDTVIGYTASGRKVTDLGFSGKGRLGEVVTFADGTQRVEIIHRNGNSSWLNTTGNYTLNDFCRQGFVPDSNIKLTPYESAIQNYAIKDDVLRATGLSKYSWANNWVAMGIDVRY